MAELLLDHGANIESQDFQDATPLMLACLAEKEDTARALLSVGANADHVAAASAKYRCIHLAARDGNTALVEALLEYGASENVRLDQPLLDTPLHLAVSNCNGSEKYVQTAKKLLDFDADIHAQNGKGYTPIHEAMENQQCSKEMVELLLEFGADIDKLDKTRHSALYYAVRNKSKHAQVLWDSSSYFTERAVSVLFHAASEGNLKRVQQLLDAGCQKDELDSFGRTAFDVASSPDVRDLLTPAGTSITTKDGCPWVRDGSWRVLIWRCDSCGRTLSGELFYRKFFLLLPRMDSICILSPEC